MAIIQRRPEPWQRLDLDTLRSHLAQTPTVLPQGRIDSIVGLTARATLAGARIGDVVTIRRRGAPVTAEVVGIDAGYAVLVPLGDLRGVGTNDPVESTGQPLSVSVSRDCLGRVLNGYGEPIDGGPALTCAVRHRVDGSAPSALSRRAIHNVMPTGLRSIDGFLTLGEGQRIGLFAGSGVGKSTLLASIAKGTSADVTVVALVGERGREVRDFIDRHLGSDGLSRSVIVVATSDAPAIERLRAAQVATTIAEFFRDDGLSVMLLVDSISRVARAQREIGLAAGEPPTRRGYPPSVFAMLPRLLERAGQGSNGAVTAIYAVLVEGGDLDEPVADELRAILDGHIVLDRPIAARGRYPAVDIVSSVSRVMDRVVCADQVAAVQRLRRIIAHYEGKRELIALGAYQKGSDAETDAAIAVMPAVERFLTQSPGEQCRFDDTVGAILKLSQRL